MADDFFEKLRKIQLSERRHATLAPIDDEFYGELKKKLTDLGKGDSVFTDDRPADYSVYRLQPSG